MKRISLLSFLLSVCILFSACSANNSPQVQQGLPPRYTIYSFDDFNMIINAPNLSDKEMDELVARESMRRIFLSTKERVNALASRILAIRVPMVNDSSILQAFEFCDYWEDSRYDVVYYIGDIMYRFYYREYESKNDYSELEPAYYAVIDDESFPMYVFDDRLGGELYMNDYKIIITVRGYSDIDQVSFEYFTLHHPDGSEPNT